jgi:hypothetical protein
MEQAEGWEHPDFPKEDYVNEVSGNIYGHPAAANIAQQELKKTLVRVCSRPPTQMTVSM